MNEMRVKNLLKGKIAIIIMIVLSFLIGMIVQNVFFSSQSIHDNENEVLNSLNDGQEEVWTCSMHPQIKLPKPGKCPICFMDLILLEKGNDDVGKQEISISPYAAKLMELETTEASRQFIESEVRMVGKVEYDETRVSYISAWVSGRLDRLYVNYTGIPVKKGDHMVSIYSPDLLTAQEELIQALKMVKELSRSDSEIVKRTAQRTIESSKEKLRLLGLSAQQIETIEREKIVNDHITIYAPESGIVIQKKAQEGMYVQTGTPIYTIADLSSVWVKLDAYETDLTWAHYGGNVEFTTETYPGRIFKGMISFIDPIIDNATRTAKVRLSVSNKKLALKPGMFVRAVVRSKVASNGHVMNEDLVGKWISPMHPEIIKDKPGKCDVCGMPLVSAESLGYVGPEHKNAPLVIPVTAAMKTGKRAVVYVEIAGREKPTYEGREVILGHRLGNYYIVEKGLSEGENVVTRGAFKLDAELQIQAKPSMMSDSTAPIVHSNLNNESKKDSEPKIIGPIDPKFRSQLSSVLDAYFLLHESLSSDNASDAEKNSTLIKDKLTQVDMGLLSGKTHMEWMHHLNKLNTAVENLIVAKTLDKQRESFDSLSAQLILTLQQFPTNQLKIYKAWCPMAFNNRGAYWLQKTEEIANPYFGEIMLRCGEIKEKIVAPSGLNGEKHE
ncbi:MAG: efflux RND transporter periplasmic adaptor subunit [Desulfobacterales bacterium]|nr:efflux RND transporter periplasmic adaptor subunit [Desulfobacterales bacterium]